MSSDHKFARNIEATKMCAIKWHLSNITKQNAAARGRRRPNFKAIQKFKPITCLYQFSRNLSKPTLISFWKRNCPSTCIHMFSSLYFFLYESYFMVQVSEICNTYRQKVSRLRLYEMRVWNIYINIYIYIWSVASNLLCTILNYHIYIFSKCKINTWNNYVPTFYNIVGNATWNMPLITATIDRCVIPV